MVKRQLLLPAIVGMLSVLSAAPEGRSQAVDRVQLQLKWVTQAQFAGYYAAKAKGFYSAENLDVTIRPGGPDIVPEQVVAGGGAQFGIDWLPSLLAARDQGAPLVNIAQVFAYSGMREIAFKASGIKSPADLRGRRVAVWFAGNEFELLATLEKYKIDRNKDVTLVQQPFDMNLLLQHKVDAAAAMTYNEYKQVLDAGVKPGDLVVIDFNREGTAMLEDGVFVKGDWLQDAKHQQLAARFLRASLKGWKLCRDKPAECVEIVLNENPTLGREHQTWMMSEINKLVWGPPAPKTPLGRMAPSAFKQTADIALKFGVIRKPAEAGAYTHDIWEIAQKRSAQQNTDPAIRIGGNDLGGVVTSANGPEAGVWVIAETTDLPTKFAKIVVTDDRGRYVMPDLPKANYRVWVRGYGLVDSPKVRTAPGKIIHLRAVVAPSRAAAAEYYPAIYWYSMLKVPDKSEFPGTGPNGNGMPAALKSQAQWLDVVKTNGCYTCHQLGNKATRTIPKELGDFKSSAEAWQRRIQSGQAMIQMTTAIGRLDPSRALKLFAEWTDRIAAGELPSAQPSRPQGVERNVVITLWDWAGPKDYLHDEISTDKRNPRVNANGPIFGATEESRDLFPVLDPVNHKATQVKMQVRDPHTPSSNQNAMVPSPYWGAEPIWDSQTSMHNPMFDEKGRVWFTSRVRPPANPDFCRKGSDHPSAKLAPIESSNRHLSMYDPKTGKITLISTCFPTHHLVFAEDANNTLWTSAGGPQSGVIGWLNRKMFEETGDEVKSQGWTALILDTNANGKRDDYVEPNEPVDSTKDKRIMAAFYGLAVNPVDATIWGSVLGFPGYVIRLNPGPNPPATALAEVFEPPLPGYGPRGMDIDRSGVVWTPLSSGHLGSFDRRRCKGPLNGPHATGQHCPEGWTLYPFPGPQLQNVTDSGSAEASYYTWVDQFDTFGLGKDVPLATGNANESLIALVDGKFVNLRVPYPMGFYAKWVDGRIDDPNAGWKGKGLWSTYATRTPFHIEGGKGTTSKVVKFQLRPDPLAR